MKWIRCGYSIEAERQWGNEPAKIRLHKMGGTGSATYMTPDEARALANDLLNAANDAGQRL